MGPAGARTPFMKEEANEAGSNTLNGEQTFCGWFAKSFSRAVSYDALSS
jgi:hypothetical protein